MQLEFVKMQGCGNDFVVVDDPTAQWDFASEAIEWICDRHFGVGGDGLILIRPGRGEDADATMVIHNADGSIAEMCGNGVRCVAKFLADRDMAGESRLLIDTAAGTKEVHIQRGDDGKMVLATVSMGAPELHPAHIPADFSGEQVFECPIQTSAGEVIVTALSMGNPHAVIWVDDVETAEVETLGPEIETDPHFPNRTNVEFAQLIDNDRIRVRVWERGVGETLACGTGACAALVASVLSCRTGRKATVELPGGALEVEWTEGGDVALTGPAEEVFDGILMVPDE